MAAAAIHALARWKPLLAGFSFRQGLRPDQVMTGLRFMADGHVKAFQLALAGTGYATAEFEADGVVGEQTLRSLISLWEAAASPTSA